MDLRASKTWTLYRWSYAGFLLLAFTAFAFSVAALIPAGTGQAAEQSRSSLRAQLRSNVAMNTLRTLGVSIEIAAKEVNSDTSGTKDKVSEHIPNTEKEQPGESTSVTLHPEPEHTQEPVPDKAPQQQSSLSLPSTKKHEKGMVSLTFDDGWDSQYYNALPVLDAAGMKGTFYITSRQLKDNGFDGFMTIFQVRDLAARGHEIGAHTRTHAHLPLISDENQRDEIFGSRNDLLSMNIGPILSFAYPYGEFNNTSERLVKEAGFSSARTTIEKEADTNTDPYRLPYRGVEGNVKFDDAKKWIERAIQSDTWLIVAFHRIDHSGDPYTTTPETFERIIKYLNETGVSVVPITEGQLMFL